MPPVRYNARVVYYTTEEKKQELEDAADERGLKFSEFMRERVETQPTNKKRSPARKKAARS